MSKIDKPTLLMLLDCQLNLIVRDAPFMYPGIPCIPLIHFSSLCISSSEDSIGTGSTIPLVDCAS